MEKSSFAEQFFEAVLTLKNMDECYKFFGDACTPKEIQAISQRFVVAKMLDKKHVYSDIVSETGASTATISRVSRSINEGYKLALSRVNNDTKDSDTSK